MVILVYPVLVAAYLCIERRIDHTGVGPASKFCIPDLNHGATN